jgi:AcrR family transcriptional regulator
MARTVKPDKYAAKRGEILDAAQRLVVTRGYEKMAIQDILEEIHISSGAFHHYFSSRGELLEALIERMQQEAEQPLLPIVRDPQMPALEKLQQFFATLEGLRASQKTFLAGLARVWYADDNAIVRQKVDEAVLERRAPLVTVIVRQGIREGVFKTDYPEEVSKVILSIALGMGNVLARILLSIEHEPDAQRGIDEIVATYGAYTDAIERVLGAASPFLDRIDAAVVKNWLTDQQDGVTL